MSFAEGEESLDGADVLGDHRVVHDVLDLGGEDLGSALPLVNPHHRHPDRPRLVANAETVVFLVRHLHVLDPLVPHQHVDRVQNLLTDSLPITYHSLLFA